MKTFKVLVIFGVCLLMASSLMAQTANISFWTRSVGTTWCPILGPTSQPLARYSFVGIYLVGPDDVVSPPSNVWGECGEPTGDDLRATHNTIGNGLDHLLVRPNGELPSVPEGCMYTANGAVVMPGPGLGTEPVVNWGSDKMYLRAFNDTIPATATHYNNLSMVAGVSASWYLRTASGPANVLVCFSAAIAIDCHPLICNPQEAAGPEAAVILAGATHYFFGETPPGLHCTLWITAGTEPITMTATLINAEPDCKPFPNTTYMTRLYDLQGGPAVESFFDIFMGYSQADYDACSWHNELETGMHAAYYDGDIGLCNGSWVNVGPPRFPAPAVIFDTPEGGYAEFMTNHLSLWSFGWGHCGDTTQLPVELTSFEATAGDHSVRLDWITASETDNRGFYIQRSTTENDEDFVTVSNLIQTQGNGPTRHDYTWLDSRLNNGVLYYYRLVDEDINGTPTIHTLKVAHATPSFFGEGVIVTEYKLYQNYPNPFNPTTNIAYDVLENGNVTLKVYNVMGQEVKTLVNEHQNTRRYAVSFDASGLSSGIYFYSVKVNSFTDTKKMLLIQ